MSKETKTVLEWLQEMPEPFMGQAITNSRACYNYTALNSPPERINLSENPISNALKNAFNFNDTPEGADYWNRVCSTIEKYGVHFLLTAFDNG